jgi:hypothetical protein
MMFALSGCFRRGMAGVSWSVTSQTGRYRDAATRSSPATIRHGFFNLSSWLTAIAGAAILLVTFHLVTSRGSTRSGRSRQRSRT